jgi:hypothetical protein
MTPTASFAYGMCLSPCSVDRSKNRLRRIAPARRFASSGDASASTVLAKASPAAAARFERLRKLRYLRSAAVPAAKPPRTAIQPCSSVPTIVNLAGIR